MSVGAVIVAAGSGERCGLGYNKLMHCVCGKPILLYTVEKFLAAKINHIIIVANECDKRAITDAIVFYDKTADIKIVLGGKTRGESVLCGLCALRDDVEKVLIHDGARPYIDPKDINKVIKALDEYDGVILAKKACDTIDYIVDGNLSTLDRDKCYVVETPQAFNKKAIIEAYEALDNNTFSDDAQVFTHKYKKSVHIVVSDYSNMKITTKNDLDYFEYYVDFLTSPESKTAKNTVFNLPKASEIRFGVGYDVHRLDKNRKLILGGLEIPYELGLLGHSDADVLIHALMDAMLSAAGLRDIGYYFPDNDSVYKGANSMKLLAQVKDIILNEGYAVNSCSATILAQAPKLSPHIDTMKQNIANALDIKTSDVGLMATTTEGLGIIGERKGIAVFAASTLKKI